MKYIKLTSIYFLITLIFASCVNLNENIINSNKVSSIDFKKISDDLINPICKDIKKDSIIYITDFVNETSLKNNSQLGFLLSNQSKVSVLANTCTTTVKIQDLQLAKQLKIGKNGSRILTREIEELKTNNLNEDKQIIVGSYIITQNQIILFVKLINLKTGDIIATTSTSRDINDEYRVLEGMQTDVYIKDKEDTQQVRRTFHL